MIPQAPPVPRRYEVSCPDPSSICPGSFLVFDVLHAVAPVRQRMPLQHRGGAGQRLVRFKADRELPKAAEALKSPYDVEARYRHKRDTQWTGYMVHVTEICEPTEPHLITHVHTTSAAVHEAKCTDGIEQALADKALTPREMFVDSAYVSAELLVKSREAYGIALRGPTRPNLSWQKRTVGAYELEHFAIDWERRQVRCPEGKTSVT